MGGMLCFIRPKSKLVGEKMMDTEILLKEFKQLIEKHLESIESVKAINPHYALVGARKTCEAICCQICFECKELENIAVGKLKLNDLIGQIKQHGLAPPHIIKYMQTIQSFGNYGAHGLDELPPNYAEPTLIALSHLASWYFEDAGLLERDPRRTEFAHSDIHESDFDDLEKFKQKVRKLLNNPITKGAAVAGGVLIAVGALGKILNKRK